MEGEEQKDIFQPVNLDPVGPEGLIKELNTTIDSVSKKTIVRVNEITYLKTSTTVAASFTVGTATRYHELTAGSAVTSDTSTAINDGLYTGQLLVLSGTSDSNTITIKNNANTALTADIVLGINDTLTLVWNGSTWLQVSTGTASTSVAVSDIEDGTDGELITWDSSGVVTTVDVGTATHVLTSNGTGTEPTFQIFPAGVDVQTFASSDTYTKPSGAVKIFVQIWAGGGSGANNENDTNEATGGGGGEYIEVWFDAGDVGSTETVTIGNGGVSVASGPGNDGNDSTFGSLLTALKGLRGIIEDGDPAAGGDGGGPFGDGVNGVGASGAIGGSGIWSGAGGGATAGNGFDGGASYMGGAGGGGIAGTDTSSGGISNFGGDGGASTMGATQGVTGSVPGGGGGAHNNHNFFNSGAGGKGQCIVTTYF